MSHLSESNVVWVQFQKHILGQISTQILQMKAVLLYYRCEMVFQAYTVTHYRISISCKISGMPIVYFPVKKTQTNKQQQFHGSLVRVPLMLWNYFHNVQECISYYFLLKTPNTTSSTLKTFFLKILKVLDIFLKSCVFQTSLENVVLQTFLKVLFLNNNNNSSAV